LRLSATGAPGPEEPDQPTLPEPRYLANRPVPLDVQAMELGNPLSHNPVDTGTPVSNEMHSTDQSALIVSVSPLAAVSTIWKLFEQTSPPGQPSTSEPVNENAPTPGSVPVPLNVVWPATTTWVVPCSVWLNDGPA